MQIGRQDRYTHCIYGMAIMGSPDTFGQFCDGFGDVGPASQALSRLQSDW